MSAFAKASRVKDDLFMALTHGVSDTGLSVLEAISGTLSQMYFCERAVTLLRLWRREAGWVLLAFAAPSILGGLALGIGAGILPFQVRLSIPPGRMLTVED